MIKHAREVSRLTGKNAPKGRVLLATLGCKVAQYETEALRELLLADGWCEVDRDADVAVVNTCTVTAESDRKCRKALRRIHRENPAARILVIGCYAQSHPEEVAALPGVAFVGGTAEKRRVLAVANGELAGGVAVLPLTGAAYEPMAVSGAPRTRAYVKIADGCDCRCTYCALPAARGPVRARPREDILNEITRLAESGTREVVLTGIETASYGRDLKNGYRLIDLLEEVDRLPIARVRLGSLTPEWLLGDTVPRLARLARLAPHLHLSVQSGSTPVLARMRRRYNAEQAMAGIHALREAIPDLHLTADMIVGFPGESKENFAETMAFAEEARFLSMHVFAYSPREGTPAAAFDCTVPEAVKAERSAALSALASRMTGELLCEEAARGRTLTVLTETHEEGGTFGHTASFLPVLIRGEQPTGELIAVRPTGVLDGALIAERCE